MTQSDPDQPADAEFARFGGAHADPVEDHQQPADPVEKTDDPVEDVQTYPHGKLPGQEDLPTLPPVGEQRGETPIVE